MSKVSSAEPAGERERERERESERERERGDRKGGSHLVAWAVACRAR